MARVDRMGSGLQPELEPGRGVRPGLAAAGRAAVEGVSGGDAKQLGFPPEGACRGPGRSAGKPQRCYWNP
ncbi:protein of unknown function [Methylacidimicrobium sp. AP8]|nr:protein of unknown function [Methylacidimicrobium sp. AP8]